MNKKFNKTSFWQKIALVIFGLFLSLILIEAGLRLGGFVILSLQELKNRVSITQKGEYRILCLGESTTQGQYPPFLEETLNRRNIGIKFSVIDKGVCGIETWAMLSRVESYLDTYHPDMVITMMGINDWGPHMPYEPVSDSKAINFLKSFRIYKLARLLWLHITNKFEELSFYKPPMQKTKLQQPLARNGSIPLKEELIKLKKAIELNPRNDWVYIKLGQFYKYKGQGKLSEAEELFKKAIKLNPKCEWAYVELGRLYRGQGRLSESEASFKKAIALNPKGVWAYVGLGELYQWQGRLSESEASFKKAIELDPKCGEAYIELGRLYHENYRFTEAEEPFKKAVELNPKGRDAYVELGRLYLRQGRFSEAEELFKKAIKFNPGNDWAYGALGVLYTEKGDTKLAKKYGKKASDLRLKYNALYTTSSYLKLKAILDKRGITYVCMQYPMRNLEMLKRIFQGNDKGIIFIDNDTIFRDAIAKDGHQAYFRDMFGGDFGHCTEKGNRLLAENIANVILKEVFGK